VVLNSSNSYGKPWCAG